MISPSILALIFTALLSFPSIVLYEDVYVYYYHNGERWEKPTMFTLNYPGKGGRFSKVSFDPSYTIKLKDGNTVKLYPIPEKEIGALNLIGEDNVKEFPSFLEERTSDENLEEFSASFKEAGLGKYFRGEATVKF